MPRFARFFAVFFAFALIGGAFWLLQGRGYVRFPEPLPQPRLTRPHGMAPVAFEAYVRACANARIHPFRMGQTIGDHPRSVGYHKQDGILRAGGKEFPYTTAIDLGTSDLSREQINAFLAHLGKQGFAAFYREKGKWTGLEHIHAVYALLPMKPQLRGQVLEWLQKRRLSGQKPHKWEIRLRKR